MKKIILYILIGALVIGGGIFVYQKINSSKVSTSFQLQNYLWSKDSKSQKNN